MAVGLWAGGQAPAPATASSVSLRWRVMLLAMSMVAMVVVLMAVAVYAVVSRALYDDIDTQLRSRANLLSDSGLLEADPGKAIESTAYSEVNAMLFTPQAIYTANQAGQTLPLGGPERDVIEGRLWMSLRTVSHQRVLAVHLDNGNALLISKSLAPTGKVLKGLGTVLLIVGGIGVAIAAIAGGMVARAGLRPVARLTEAAERVARTDDLRPIPVYGSDELARLTEAFNMMLRALTESRERQTRLVTDAGHELRTPLTSLRTNVELLMASMKPGAPRLPEEEMTGLRADVLAQIEELSTLVGDLVDLTREDAGGIIHETVELGDVIERSLERVRRRRNDIEFDISVTPWQVYGDAGGPGPRGAQPSGQRREVEPARWPCQRAAHTGRRAARGAGGIRSRSRNSAAGTESRFRTVLQVDRGPGDAGVGPRPGDRQAGGAQARRHVARPGNRSGWSPAGYLDARGAARSAFHRRRRSAGVRTATRGN